MDVCVRVLSLNRSRYLSRARCCMLPCNASTGSFKSFRMETSLRRAEMAFTNTMTRPGCCARMWYRSASRSSCASESFGGGGEEGSRSKSVAEGVRGGRARRATTRRASSGSYEARSV
eukprot:31300-Pelagococcus_subviridis.AAC.2